MTRQSKSAQTLEKILLAATRCYGNLGVEQTSLEQVATEADVSRATVYRHAKNQRELLNKVMLREADAALSELQSALKYRESLDQVVVESILFLMRRREYYQAQSSLYGGDAGLGQGGGMSPQVLRELTENALRDDYRKAAANNAVPGGMSLAILSDWVSRITMSLLGQPLDIANNEQSLREYLQVVLVPIFCCQSAPCQALSESNA